MKQFLVIVFTLASFLTQAQVQKEDGTWWDNNLEFKIVDDFLKQFGELEICIYDSKRESCIENLVTAYEVRIYNAQQEELWNSLWTGKDMDMIFKKNFPDANYIVIKALRPFVINSMTGTRIYQDEPMELKYTVK